MSQGVQRYQQFHQIIISGVRGRLHQKHILVDLHENFILENVFTVGSGRGVNPARCSAHYTKGRLLLQVRIFIPTWASDLPLADPNRPVDADIESGMYGSIITFVRPQKGNASIPMGYRFVKNPSASHQRMNNFHPNGRVCLPPRQYPLCRAWPQPWLG